MFRNSEPQSCSEYQSERMVMQETVRYQELKEIIARTDSNNTIMIVSRPKKRLIQTERGSKYRGVSKNGKKWQVRIDLMYYNFYTLSYYLFVPLKI